MNAHAAGGSSHGNSVGASWKEQPGQRSQCVCYGGDDHEVVNCTPFQDLTIDERWKVVKENRLCSRCLIAHSRWPCEGQVCGLNGC